MCNKAVWSAETFPFCILLTSSFLDFFPFFSCHYYFIIAWLLSICLLQAHLITFTCIFLSLLSFLLLLLFFTPFTPFLFYSFISISSIIPFSVISVLYKCCCQITVDLIIFYNLVILFRYIVFPLISTMLYWR